MYDATSTKHIPIIIVKDNYEEPGVVTSGETCFNVFFVLYGENVFDLYTNFLIIIRSPILLVKSINFNTASVGSPQANI